MRLWKPIPCGTYGRSRAEGDRFIRQMREGERECEIAATETACAARERYGGHRGTKRAAPKTAGTMLIAGFATAMR